MDHHDRRRHYGDYRRPLASGHRRRRWRASTTTTAGINLGFKAKLVRDATWTFDREGVDGEHFSADQVHAMTLANLQGEFAEIVTTTDVMSRLSETWIAPSTANVT